MTKAKLPLDVLNNLDLILTRDNIYLTQKQLEAYNQLLMGKMSFNLALNEYLLM